ncbi:uncharacterized protein [Scyliorhinus torazame]|uniref:uncharacterized protein n=1 Tax=Scyliorhinus torazame TaxID=75743 RepID=UPI003B5B4B2B
MDKHRQRLTYKIHSATTLEKMRRKISSVHKIRLDPKRIIQESAALGKYTIRQIPDSLSVREGEQFHIGCVFNLSSRGQLEVVAFKWTSGNFSILTIKDISNKTYDTESTEPGVRIEADVRTKRSTLIVDQATRGHTGVYMCVISVIKPLAMQTGFEGNGTVVTVREMKRTSSLLVSMATIGLMLILFLTICLVTRRVSQGKALKTVCASPRSEPGPDSNQCNKEPETFVLGAIYSSLSLSMMKPPGRERGGERPLTIYATVHRPGNGIGRCTVSHTVQLKQEIVCANQHCLPQSDARCRELDLP